MAEGAGWGQWLGILTRTNKEQGRAAMVAPSALGLAWAGSLAAPGSIFLTNHYDDLLATCTFSVCSISDPLNYVYAPRGNALLGACPIARGGLRLGAAVHGGSQVSILGLTSNVSLDFGCVKVGLYVRKYA